MKRFLFIPVILAVLLLGFYFFRQSGPAELPVAQPTRQRLETNLSTNGKVEPVEYVLLRAGREGRVDRIAVSQGQTVSSGQLLVALDSSQFQSQLAGANARIQGAQAELDVVTQGGRRAELTSIENQLESQRDVLRQAQADLTVTERLRAKNAATEQQVTELKRRIETANLEIANLERRRSAIVQPTDRTSAEARIRAAQSEAQEANTRIAAGLITAPISGTVYDLPLKPGGYLNPGDPVASIGKLNQVRIRLYIDEPDLGKIKLGTPVNLTWDAYPGRIWKGTVDRLATQVIALGTRQVGEVAVLVDNEDRVLLPGTNINAEVKAAVVENALSIPREALRRQNNQDGVLVLDNGTVRFRPIKIGVASVSRFQVLEGLTENDQIILPTESEVREGMQAKAKGR